MKAPHDSGPVALESGQDLVTDPDTSKRAMGVGGVIQRNDPSPAQEVEHLESPDSQDWAHEHSTTRGHAAETRQPTTTHQVQHCSLDDIVRGMCQRHDVRTGLLARAFEEVVSK